MYYKAYACKFISLDIDIDIEQNNITVLLEYVHNIIDVMTVLLEYIK